MYAIGTDLATGDVMIRNYGNGTAIRIPAGDIALVADMVRIEYPECGFCDGTVVDGYCTDCGLDADGLERTDKDEGDIWVAPPGDHDHDGRCALCAVENGTCCDHCPGNPAYDPDAVRAALEGTTP